jgi:hypothetical protein
MEKEQCMQFFVHSPEGEGHSPFNPGPEVMAEMGKYMEEAVKKGIIVAGGGLARKSTYLQLAGGKIRISDGPFIESKEFIPGFTMIQVTSREEALEWVIGLRKIIGDGEFRITQVYGPS